MLFIRFSEPQIALSTSLDVEVVQVDGLDVLNRTKRIELVIEAQKVVCARVEFLGDAPQTYEDLSIKVEGSIKAKVD